MRPALTVSVEVGPLERASAELAVATLFEHDRPLRGEAGRADWRLCGLLSELVGGAYLRGRAGEVALVHTRGRLRAPRLLVLGLGRAASLTPQEIRATVGDAVERAVRLRATTLALTLPGHWSGTVPPAQAAGALLQGAAEASAHCGEAIRIRLVVPEGSASKALGGLEVAAERLGGAAGGIRITAEEAVAFAPSREAEPGRTGARDPGLRPSRQVRPLPTDP